MPWHDIIQKNMLLFICRILPGTSRHTEPSWLDNRSGLRSDGLGAITFHWKIPGETCIMNQKATASALKSFLLVGSYSSTGQERSTTEMRFRHNLPILVAGKHPPSFHDFACNISQLGSYCHFSCVFCRCYTGGFDNAALSSHTPHVSSLFDALRHIRDTQPEPEAGHGSLVTAERWYLCIPEKFPVFDYYKTQMGHHHGPMHNKTERENMSHGLEKLNWRICSRMSPAGRLSRSVVLCPDTDHRIILVGMRSSSSTIT